MRTHHANKCAGDFWVPFPEYRLGPLDFEPDLSPQSGKSDHLPDYKSAISQSGIYVSASDFRISDSNGYYGCNYLGACDFTGMVTMHKRHVW